MNAERKQIRSLTMFTRWTANLHHTLALYRARMLLVLGWLGLRVLR
jgi:hypothetical protein